MFGAATAIESLTLTCSGCKGASPTVFRIHDQVEVSGFFTTILNPLFHSFSPACTTTVILDHFVAIAHQFPLPLIHFHSFSHGHYLCFYFASLCLIRIVNSRLFLLSNRDTLVADNKATAPTIVFFSSFVADENGPGIFRLIRQAHESLLPWKQRLHNIHSTTLKCDYSAPNVISPYRTLLPFPATEIIAGYVRVLAPH